MCRFLSDSRLSFTTFSLFLRLAGLSESVQLYCTYLFCVRSLILCDFWWAHTHREHALRSHRPRSYVCLDVGVRRRECEAVCQRAHACARACVWHGRQTDKRLPRDSSHLRIPPRLLIGMSPSDGWCIIHSYCQHLWQTHDATRAQRQHLSGSQKSWDDGGRME